MTGTPLIPAAVYGLRTWGSAADADGEYLTAVAKGTRWPDGGAWLHAACAADAGHEAPRADCDCGIYAWHPRRASARRVLASRLEIPGVVEAAGAIEMHAEGFRAQRARPRALAVLPGRNAKLVERLARRYDAEVVPVKGPDDLLAWCRVAGLGLGEDVVDDLLGPEAVAQGVQERRRTARRNALRLVAAVVLSVVLFALGSRLLTDPPGPHDLFGRTGKVHRP